MLHFLYILCLGVDRLDKELTVGQMQGVLLVGIVYMAMNWCLSVVW